MLRPPLLVLLGLLFGLLLVYGLHTPRRCATMQVNWAIPCCAAPAGGNMNPTGSRLMRVYCCKFGAQSLFRIVS